MSHEKIRTLEDLQKARLKMADLLLQTAQLSQQLIDSGFDVELSNKAIAYATHHSRAILVTVTEQWMDQFAKPV